MYPVEFTVLHNTLCGGNDNVFQSFNKIWQAPYEQNMESFLTYIGSTIYCEHRKKLAKTVKIMDVQYLCIIWKGIAMINHMHNL